MKIRLEHVPEERVFVLPKDYEWVQLTYNCVRVSPDGDFIGSIDKHQEWIFDGVEGKWSDVIIG